MKKQGKWVVGLGVVVLIVLLSLSRRESGLAELVPAAAGQTVEEPVSATAEAGISELVGLDEQKDEVVQVVKTEKEDPEAALLLETDEDEDSEIDLEFPGESEERVSEEQAVSDKANLPPVETEPEAQVLSTPEETIEQDLKELGSDEVDAIEDSLSVGDYARGLSLLAQLPVETVDRFVALRKDGFTAEEQAEVKAILLDSFEGEDLDWIVETYHKLQP